jgi:hypothetical protein
LLSNELEEFVEEDEFGFKSELKLIDKKLDFHFEIQRGEFIAKKVKEMYIPLGIGDESKVI